MTKHTPKQKPENENKGTILYISLGKIFIRYGLLSFLILCFVHTLPQDYEKYNIPLFFGIWFAISLVVVLAGLVLIILCKKSKKFQAWARKDVLQYEEHFMGEKRK